MRDAVTGFVKLVVMVIAKEMRMEIAMVRVVTMMVMTRRRGGML